MNELPPEARRRTLLILWGAMVSSAIFYSGLAVFLSQTRSNLNGPYARPDHLTGSLSLLPYLLPFALFPLGAGLYNRIALKGVETPRMGGRPKTQWSAVQIAFIVLLAVFELNVLVGLLFFFMGSPLEKFLPFAVGTIALDVLGLRRLMDTWPTEE